MPVPTEHLKVAIVNAATKKTLGAESPTSADGALVVRDHPAGGPDPQRWQLVPVQAREDRAYVIRDASSGKVLDNPAVADRRARQWAANGGPGQQWRVIAVEGEADLYRVECVNGGAVLDLAAGQDNPRVVLREHDDGAESQRWRFVPAEPERTAEPALRWASASHWNGRRSWRLVRSTALRPTPDATPSFSDMRLVLGRFGGDEAGVWDTRPPGGGHGLRAGARFLADVTGQGRVDLVGIKPAKGVVASAGRGDGTFEDTERVLLPYTAPNDDSRRGDLWCLVDTTGSGRLDVVVLAGDGVRVARQGEDGKFAPWGNEPAVRAFGHGKQAGEWHAERHPRFLVDTTGDGRVDVVGFHDDGLRVARQDEHGKFAPVTGAPALQAFGYGVQAGGWHAERHPRFLVDTTGDGRVDVVGFHDDGVWVSHQDEEGKFAEPVFVLDDFGVDQGWVSVEEHPRFLLRTTAGGPLDIVGFGPQGVVVSRGRADGAFGEAELVLNDFGRAQGWTADRHLRLLADLTGDGNLDVVGFGDEGVWVSPGRGGGAFDQARLVCRGFGHADEAGGWRVDRHPRFLADVTGDGRVDVVGFGGPGVYVARNLVRRFMTR
ncbi:RICIN domain-containing protein [Saccharothrix australiensis]|uniref:Ricin-type beta-trefoil lectin protein n=1 Tax=Saccharothrix australiensis TaxID=2072 RepID=A0A495W099_9PSEU|nr:RICIN domain-containing protein [Saccharothrix australiensis]RKT54560.1 ricin-type beta-trefoil lectin protein [Saccharothrix australiensis]